MDEGTSTTIPSNSNNSSECCMCGDYGFSHQLFKCNICLFRSQHRYCSNKYPKAESYKTCNWCLNQKDQNSSNSSSTCRDDDVIVKKNNGDPIKKLQRSSPEKSPVSPLAGRKRVIVRSSGADVAVKNRVVLRKSKSENQILSGAGGGGGGGAGAGGGGVIIKTKQIFRNKVRRYKFLDEVSSQ